MPEPIIFPVIFNVDKHVVALLNVLAPVTVNDPCNAVLPETLNDDTNVDALLKLGIAGGFNIAL